MLYVQLDIPGADVGTASIVVRSHVFAVTLAVSLFLLASLSRVWFPVDFLYSTERHCEHLAF